MDAVLSALVVAVLGGPIAYFLGVHRTRLERLEEKRAEVIARLSELLFEVQQGYLSSTSPFGYMGEDRREKISKATQNYGELYRYYHSHSVWLDPETRAKLEGFMAEVWKMDNDYMDDLDDRGYPKSKEGRDVAKRVREKIPALREDLAERFRAILYPRPWWRRVFGA